MLYNPQWKKPSLDGFIDFLATRDPAQSYHYCSGRKCAVGQYLQSLGLEYYSYIMQGKDEHRTVFFLDHGIGFPKPHSFGAAHDRAKSIRHNRPQLEQEWQAVYAQDATSLAIMRRNSINVRTAPSDDKPRVEANDWWDKC